jgi:hypothetical protein
MMREPKTLTGICQLPVYQDFVVVTGGSPFFLSGNDGVRRCLSSTSEVWKHAYVDGDTSYALSLEDGETKYYLTTRGWVWG